eukprot:g53002.t1
MCSSMRVFATECERKYSTMAVMLSPEGEQELLNKTLVTEINTFLTSGASRVEKEWRRYTGLPGSMRVQAQAWLGEMLTATRETHKVIFEELQKLPAEYRGTTVVTHWLPHKIVDLGKCKSELNPMPREWCPCRTSQGAQVQCCPGCENLVITKDAEKGSSNDTFGPACDYIICKVNACTSGLCFFCGHKIPTDEGKQNTHGPHFKVMPQNVKKFLSQHGWNVKTTWGWCRRRPWFVQHPGHAVREGRQKVRILAPGIEAGGSLQKLIDNQQKQRNATVPLVPLDAATDEGDSQQGQKPGKLAVFIEVDEGTQDEDWTRERHELILFYAYNEWIPEEASCDVLADGLTWLPMRGDASGRDTNQTQDAVFIMAGHQLQTTCLGLNQIQEFTVDRNFSKGTKCTVLVGKVMIRPTRSKREFFLRNYVHLSNSALITRRVENYDEYWDEKWADPYLNLLAGPQELLHSWMWRRVVRVELLRTTNKIIDTSERMHVRGITLTTDEYMNPSLEYQEFNLFDRQGEANECDSQAIPLPTWLKEKWSGRSRVQHAFDSARDKAVAITATLAAMPTIINQAERRTLWKKAKEMGRRKWDKTITATNVERRGKRRKALPLYEALQSEFQDNTSSEDEDEIQVGRSRKDKGDGKAKASTSKSSQRRNVNSQAREQEDSVPIRYGTRVRLNKLDLEMIHEKQLDSKTMRWYMDHMARELNLDEDNAVVIVTIDLVHKFRNRGWEAVRKMVPQFGRDVEIIFFPVYDDIHKHWSVVAVRPVAAQEDKENHNMNLFWFDSMPNEILPTQKDLICRDIITHGSGHEVVRRGRHQPTFEYRR